MENTISSNFNAISDYQNQLKDVMGVTPKGKTGTEEESLNQTEFSSYLSKALDNMDSQVTTSSNNIEKLITGDLDNMHTAMIDMSKSQLVLQTAVQVRNKCVESYNEIKNMQF